MWPCLRHELNLWFARLRAWARTREGRLFLGLLALAVVVRALLAPVLLFPTDPQLDVTWGREFLAHPLNFYSYTSATYTFADYPPLSIYLFSLVVGISAAAAHLAGAQPSFALAQSPPLTVAIKLVPLVCDLGLTAVIFAIARKRVTLPWALAAAAAYAFSPYVLVIGALWGQQDAIYVLAIVLALLLAFAGKEIPAGVLSAAAVLLKPQPVVLLPLLAVSLWRWYGSRSVARYAAALGATAVVIASPFLLPPHLQMLAYLHNVGVVNPAVSSRGALNFWWLVGSSIQFPDGIRAGSTIPLFAVDVDASRPFIGPLSIAVVAWLCVGASVVWASYAIWRARSARAYFGSACLVTMTFYLFGTQQDVRYFMPALVLLLIEALYERSFAGPFAVASVVITLNSAIYLLAFSASARERVWLGPAYQWLLVSPWVLPLLAYVMLAIFSTALVLSMRGWVPAATGHSVPAAARTANAFAGDERSPLAVSGTHRQEPPTTRQ